MERRASVSSSGSLSLSSSPEPGFSTLPSSPFSASSRTRLGLISSSSSDISLSSASSSASGTPRLESPLSDAFALEDDQLEDSETPRQEPSDVRFRDVLPAGPFPSHSEAMEAMHEHALSHGYRISVCRSRAKRSFTHLGCRRRGELQPSNKPRGGVSGKPRQRRSSRCGCPFSALLKRNSTTKLWHLEMIHDGHNHVPAAEGESVTPKLNAEHLNLVERLFEQGKKPREIRSELEAAGRPGIKIKAVYNAIQTVKRRRSEARGNNAAVDDLPEGPSFHEVTASLRALYEVSGAEVQERLLAGVLDLLERFRSVEVEEQGRDEADRARDEADSARDEADSAREDDARATEERATEDDTVKGTGARRARKAGRSSLSDSGTAPAKRRRPASQPRRSSRRRSGPNLDPDFVYLAA